MGLIPMVLALAYRSLFLLFPQTFFQPDEFWQSLEPAHHHVFGYGYLTWEWRDLPDGGRLRGWLWPSCFIGIYRVLQWAGLDDTFLLTFAPRMVGVIIAAVTDWATYRLSSKLMGPGSAAGAFFLSVSSLFHAHVLPRSLSNSPETLSTTLALVYFPFRAAGSPKAIVVGDGGLAASRSMKNLARTSTQAPKQGMGHGDDSQELVYDDVGDINYAVMDRLGPDVVEQEGPIDSLVLSLFFAGLAMCIRTTTLPLWLYLGPDYLIRVARRDGLAAGVYVGWLAVLTGVTVLTFSTGVDYYFTGKLYFPFWSFFQQNLINNIAAFYGKTDPFYHLVQSLPILLFPIWYWWIQGFAACLLPRRLVPSSLASLDRPPGMRTLARAITFAITILSFSPHSEWRFVHPYLPALLIFALPPLFRSYTPTIIGAYRFTDGVRQYTRIPKRSFYFILLVPIIPYAYLNVFHGRAQVAVMEALRSGSLGQVTSLAVVMNCHNTPWASHLHRNIPSWFLTCEPPLERESLTFVHESKQFYNNPVFYMEDILSDAQSPGWSWTGHDHPSHVIIHESLVDTTGQCQGEERSIRDILQKMGYTQAWSRWNGFDWAHEDDAKGKLNVWARSDLERVVQAGFKHVDDL